MATFRKAKFKDTPTSLPTKGVKSLANLNWEKLEELDSTDQFREAWVLPHLMAFLAKAGNVILVRNEDKLISASDTLKDLSDRLDKELITFDNSEVVTKKAFTNILEWIKCKSRSNIIPAGATQASTDWCRYGGIVPLFMSAFKEFRNVGYSQWDLTDPKLKFFIDPLNLEVLQSIGKGYQTKWEPHQLQEFLAVGRKFIGGVKIGKSKHLNLCSKLNDVGDEEFDSLPQYPRSLLCQTWLYQPQYYTQYGIYSLDSPDARPVNNISMDVFKPKEEEESPWN